MQLVPAELWAGPSHVDAPFVMPDIQPYQSMQTGELITSRSHHRSHLKQHGLVEIGNEINHHMKKSQPRIDREGIRRDLIEAVKRHS